MRKCFFTRATFFTAALVIAGTAQAADEAAHSMTGCLQQGSAAGSYELTDLGLADGPKRVVIAASTVDLSGHVGHKVEITGTTVKGADAATHTMTITAMKHIAATCP
jgi:hypothetical protein